MASQGSRAIAFERPGGERTTPSRGRPVDLVHLARQTGGDRALEQEVLAMFLQQVSGVRDRIAGAGAEDRRRMAHTLKGSARSVGAFALSDCAAMIEESPTDQGLFAALSRRIDEVRDFIATISR